MNLSEKRREDVTNKQWNDLAEATLASVGVMQSAYERFLNENDNNENIALRLTQITWEGIMKAGQANKEDDGNKLF